MYMYLCIHVHPTVISQKYNKTQDSRLKQSVWLNEYGREKTTVCHLGVDAKIPGRTWVRNIRVLGVLQNSHLKQVKLGALEYSGINQAIEIVPHMQVVFRHIDMEQVTWLFCLHHLGRRSTPAYASTDVPAHLISVLPVRSERSKGNS